MSLVLVLLGLSVSLLATPLGPGPLAAQDQRVEDVRYPGGGVELAAELVLPAAETALPGAVVLQGSGDSDRTNAWAAGIAAELAKNGLVVLLTDKRGCGASGGDWRTSGFDELARDALAGVAFLRDRPEVDPERVGLVGLSQGGWIAPIAAARSNEVAFLIDVSGCTVSFAEQTTLEMANTTRQAGLDEHAIAEVLALHRLTGRVALGGSWTSYARARERGLQSSWASVARGFPAERDDPIWTFLGKVAAFDPLPYWSVIDVPVLVAYGEEDERDNVPVRESVRRLERTFELAHRDPATILVVPGVGHSLWVEQGRFAPEFLDVLASWIETTLAP